MRLVPLDERLSAKDTTALNRIAAAPRWKNDRNILAEHPVDHFFNKYLIQNVVPQIIDQ